MIKRDITLVCADTLNRQKALNVVERMIDIFPFKQALFFTNNVQSDKVKIVDIPDIKGQQDYSRFILLELYKHITTQYVLIVQHDGYIINPHLWREEFFQYDYIGAPWSDEHMLTHRRSIASSVGNGGFSFRSKKFLLACKEIFYDKRIDTCEDIQCCIYEYISFIKKGIKFAPVNVAFKFSIEDVIPQNFTTPFGFHASECDPDLKRLNLPLLLKDE